MNSTEIIFLVEQDPEGGYVARALTESIFTEAEDLDSLKNEIRDAIHLTPMGFWLIWRNLRLSS